MHHDLVISMTQSLNDPVARLLIAHGADPNIPDVDGYTPLHNASMRGLIEIVRLLIELGANLEVKDKQGRTPLGLATRHKHEETVKLLSEHVAK